jgi:hypothetical protein
MTDMTDEQPATDVVTVFDRMHAAGICQESIERHLAGGHVHVDGERVTDPYHPAPLSVPRTRTRHATCTYSCTRPPSRSRRSGRSAALDGGGVAPVGGC